MSFSLIFLRYNKVEGLFMKKILTMLLLTTLSTFAITVGEVPKEVTIENEQGGLLNGTAWNSTTVKEKIHVMFYVDPDEKDTNNEFSEALKAKGYDRSKFASIAIVNLEATWLPNFAIESSLEEKQKAYPETIYVKDKEKVLVKEWSLADDSSDILIFDTTGKVIYLYAGKLDSSEIEKALKLIDSLL